MNNELTRSLTTWYATVATAYWDTASKMYEAHMSLVSEMSKLTFQDMLTKK